MRQYKRSDRLSGQMLRDISHLFETDMQPPISGMLTFTRVELTDDLRYAKVFYSCFGSEAEREQLAAYLQQESPHIRARIGRQLRIRHVPELRFVFDKSIEGSIRIEQLLNEIKRERKDDESD
ncbi:MAG: 30S ribosome-binding factor RbfA [candidate division Zixibacteria bacterium]|jgi:ribosome-binding factor A|nr:30S ribosome-binding factor RbfA [candidate division Zixibacteria bacterium]